MCVCVCVCVCVCMCVYEWLTYCRKSIGVVKGGTFMKLMEALVDSVLLYDSEVWGCARNSEAMEQVQLQAYRIF